MTDYADLEIRLLRWSTGSYGVDLRYSPPGSATDLLLTRDGPRPVQFDFDGLRERAEDVAGYGHFLGRTLFADGEVQRHFRRARDNAQAQSVALRLRLLIESRAVELHSLRWETLCDPDDGSALATREQVLFSRFLSSQDWRPVRLRPRDNLRALVAVASPRNVGQYSVERRGLGPPDGGGEPAAVERRQLAPIDLAGEQARAKASLNTLIVSLVEPGGASLTGLINRLRDGYDILYLVCHGALHDGQPWLWLEDESGDAARVRGGVLVDELSRLEQRPRLVVLASCQSAGRADEARSDDEGVLSALGPLLAEAGIPAVLAMQGNVSMATAGRFMSTFFQQLQKDGEIDRATAVARWTVRDRPDWWVPVLFMQLKDGRLWAGPGVASEQPDFEWQPLVDYIRDGYCTPILGPALTDALFVSRGEMARDWAAESDFPLARNDWDNLPRVAQFLAISRAANIPRMEYVKSLRSSILSRYEGDLPAELRAPDAPLEALLSAVGAMRRQRDPEAEPHAVLARLGLPLYITTNADNLLAEALKEEALKTGGNPPRVELCRWSSTLEQLPSVFDEAGGYRPSPREPLIYHLFGRLEEPGSLVLTQDNYFDYLIGVTSNRDLIPSVVKARLSDTALLFLGFQLDDWNFRVLFRSIMTSEGRMKRSEWRHAAVQIDPEGSQTIDPRGARRYLERYFQSDNISIFWGSAKEFLHELQLQLSRGRP